MELAYKYPEIEFIIKHKGVSWSETEELLQQLNASSIANLKIYGESQDAHKLILDSDVVTGFCSTSLFEASIANKPVVYPLYAEALDKKYNQFVCFKDPKNLFDIAKSSEEYKELLIKRYRDTTISESTKDYRVSQFEKYVSSADADAAKQYTEVISNIVSNY